MKFLLILVLFATPLLAADKLPSGERWLPESIPDYLELTVLSHPCESRTGHGLWMIRVRANIEDLDIENFYLLPYLWDKETGNLLMFSSNLVSEAHGSTHFVDFSFHPKLLDQVVVAASLDSKKHIILASDFFEGQRCF